MEWFENDDFWREFYPFMFSDERFAATPDEVTRILALAQCNVGSVLDLCCGPGRHSVELAQRGFKVTGVDRSPFLLERAREHAAKAGASVEWIKQDMREFIRPAGFDLALSLFTSFGYFEDEQDDLRVLRNIHQSLKENGVLIIEVLGKERLARVWKDTMCNELTDGSLIFQRPQIRDDWTRIRSEWTLVKDGRARSFIFEHTIYSGRELKDRLLSCGFKHVQLFGDQQGSPYGLDAQRLIAVARKSSSMKMPVSMVWSPRDSLPYDRVFAASRRIRAMNVEAQVTWTDGERFVANASSGHAIVIDSDRQRNTAAGPMEMVLMGLCACTATDVVSILRKKREPFAGVHVKAEAVRATEAPTVYTSIKLIYTVSGQVSRKAVEDAVRLSEEKYCGVSAMLKCTAKIVTEVHLSGARKPLVLHGNRLNQRNK